MDPREGRDIVITTNRNDKGWSVVTSIMAEDPSVLTDPKSPQAKEWMANEETWRDVYSVKPVEFVNIVAEQKTPVWDSELKKFVAEEDKEEKEEDAFKRRVPILPQASPDSSGKGQWLELRR